MTEVRLFYHLIRLVVPLVFSNILHMIVIRMGWLPELARPVSTALFGAHKTWRGFILLPILNAIAVALFSYRSPFWPSLFLGAVLGLAYLLFELPNSYLKRRMGIAPGQAASRNRYLFMLLDKTDSAFGVTLAYYLLTDITLPEAGMIFLIGSMAHILFSLLLVSLRIKRSF